MLQATALFTAENYDAESKRVSFTNTIARLAARRKILPIRGRIPRVGADKCTECFYRHGYLVQLDRDRLSVKILNLHRAEANPLYIGNMAQYTSGFNLSVSIDVRIHNYESGVLILSFHGTDDTGASRNRLMAWRVDLDSHDQLSIKIYLDFPCECEENLNGETTILRNTQTHLVRLKYSQDHRFLEVWRLREQINDEDESVRLLCSYYPGDLFRCRKGRWDLGSDFTCEIYGDEFVLVGLSHWQSKDCFEPDQNMFYSCLRLTLLGDDNFVEKDFHDSQIFRRSTKEGPIADNWTRLSLQRDEGTGGICLVESGLVWRIGSSTQQRQVMIVPLFLQKDGLVSVSQRPQVIQSEPKPGHLREDVTLYSSYSLASRAFVDLVKGDDVGDKHTLSLYVSHANGADSNTRQSMLLEEVHTNQQGIDVVGVLIDERTLVYAYKTKPSRDSDKLQVRYWSFDPYMDLQKLLHEARAQ